MQIFILTISPEMFQGPFNCGLFQKAVDKGVVKVDIRNIRDYTHDKHHTTDDTPYGGGAGMVMKPEPIFEAVETIKAELAQQEITRCAGNSDDAARATIDPGRGAKIDTISKYDYHLRTI